MTTTRIDDPPTVRAGKDEQSWIEPPAGLPSRYEVLSQIGTGGMAVVYKVHDRETGDIVALKVLKSGMASDPVMQENLKREVCLARKVTHRNVCRIHEYGRSNGTAYVTMEFVEGESLLSKLQSREPLPWNEALGITRQICVGLGEAHVQGIVHRDLKPANIMMDHNGDVKIMDFGIARLFQGTGQMTRTMVGTPAYMAPEQVELMRADARTDVYALGLLLYEMVTGAPAFEGETPIAVALKQLREFPRRPREIVPELPASAEAVIVKCLQKDPAKRFQSVDQLALALKRESQAKRPVSIWASFVVDLRRAGHDLHRDLRPSIDAAAGFLQRQKQQNWRALITKHAKMILAGSLGVAFLLSGIVVMSARRDAKSQVPGAAANAAWAVPSDERRNSARAAQPAVVPPIAAYAIDLGALSSGTTSNPIKSSSGDALPAQSSPEPAASRPERKIKAPVAAPRLPARQAAPSVDTAQEKFPKPDADASAASASDAASSGQKADDTPSELSASLLPNAAPSAPAGAASSEKPAEGSPVQPGRYFEVGSFKDPVWANQAIEKLTQLGFHAVSANKNVLWMQSYQVRVGPYTDPRDMEAARESLASQGFKPHPVK